MSAENDEVNEANQKLSIQYERMQHNSKEMDMPQVIYY